MNDQSSARMLARIDDSVLGGMELAQGDSGAPRALFLPANFGEAMELSKLMAAGLAVPPHLRGKPADCLAVLMQAVRWTMDPFAVASKSYFVNDRLAYEAQLVNAVLNTSGALKGRLTFEWDQQENDLVCTVTGTLKADPNSPKSVTQGFMSVKPKNSPLWQSSPRQQLGYYTSRMWARLYAPEVLLGVYTVDEVEDMGLANARNVTPAQPTRLGVREHVITADVERVEDEPSEEETARALDAETFAAVEGRTDEEVVEERPEAAQAEEPEKDWGPTITKIEEDFETRTTVIDLNAYWSDARKIFADAPEDVRNRVGGLYEARKAELSRKPSDAQAEPANTLNAG